MELKIAVPEQSVLMAPAQSMLELMESIEIDSDVMYEEAGTELQKIKRRASELDTQRKGLVGPLNETVKKINDLFRAPLDALTRGEQIIKSKMIRYTTEQERIAAEQRRVAEEAVRKERERIAAEAAAAEAKAQAEAAELRRKAAEAEAAGNAAQAAKLASRAESREEAGAEKAAELTMAANAVAHTALSEVRSTPKASGIATRGTWKAEVVSKVELIAFVASNPQFLHLVDVNQSALNQLAKVMKSEFNVKGAQAYEDKTVAARRAA